MSAPAAVAFRKIPMIHTFPNTPLWQEMGMAGMKVERGKLCDCGRRFFAQSLVNTDYLDSLRGDQSRMFVDAVCEIEKMDKPPGFRIWTPNKCFQCAQRDNQPPVQADLMDNVEDRYR